MNENLRVSILKNGKAAVTYADGKCCGSMELTHSEMAEIARQYELNCAIEDVKSYASEHDIPCEYTEADLEIIARRVIKRHDNCDMISGAYWSIVDNVIKEFNEE